MMGVMNVMCGNVEMECAYAVFKAFNIRRDEQNIFEQIGQSCHMIHNRAPYHEKYFCPIVNVFSEQSENLHVIFGLQ